MMTERPNPLETNSDLQFFSMTGPQLGDLRHGVKRAGKNLVKATLPTCAPLFSKAYQPARKGSPQLNTLTVVALDRHYYMNEGHVTKPLQINTYQHLLGLVTAIIAPD